MSAQSELVCLVKEIGHEWVSTKHDVHFAPVGWFAALDSQFFEASILVKGLYGC